MTSLLFRLAQIASRSSALTTWMRCMRAAPPSSASPRASWSSDDCGFHHALPGNSAARAPGRRRDLDGAAVAAARHECAYSGGLRGGGVHPADSVAEAGYAVITFGGMKPVMSAQSALVAAGLVLSLTDATGLRVRARVGVCARPQIAHRRVAGGLSSGRGEYRRRAHGD
jgi:hypothetical protein